MWHASDLLNIEAAENINQGLTRITTREIQESLGTGTAATMSILHDHLRVRKRCTCESPTRCQTNYDRLGFVLCEFVLRKVNGSRSKLTWEVLAGDETWIYRYDPETKMQSTVWLFLDESPLHKLER